MGDLIRALRDVLIAVMSARAALRAAATALDDAASRLALVAAGTSDGDLILVHSRHRAAAAELRSLERTVVEADAAIRGYMLRVAGTGLPSSPPRSSNSPAVSRTPPLSHGEIRPAGVVNQHGDRYPPHAQRPEALPPRVLRGQNNAPIVGHVEIGGHDEGRITADRGDDWVVQVQLRLSALRMGYAGSVVHHVEMKVVAMMVRHGADRARVTINHAPCGYGQSLAGCHQYLPDFLPPGHTLTVLGTDALGNPFSETYEGKART